MNDQKTVELYEQMAQVTKQMLLAAQQQEWDRLSELEQSCAQYVEQLKMLESAAPLDDEARDRKVASIRQILADDKEIRSLVSPWMVKLNSMMNSSQTEKKLLRTYQQ